VKKIVCRCEDVTEREILDAVERGYDDIESLKRYVGIGTGPCQGKNCLARAAAILVEQGKLVERPITARIPAFPLPLGMLAEEGQTDDR